MIDTLEARFGERLRVKNGQLVDSSNNAKAYVRIRKQLTEFTKEKYGRAFSTYYFTDINEQFLLDFAFWTKEKVSVREIKEILQVNFED